jgi:drug/metabolite transporter (DMT)-like permease
VLAALSGTALILGSGIDGSPLGIGFGLAAALIYSVYILVGGKVLREEDPLAAAAVVMLAAAAVFGVQMLLQVPAPPTTPTAWAAVIAIALVSTIVAMVGFFAGLRRLGAADAATLSTLEPVVTFVLAALVLGEPVGPLQVLGGGIVRAGGAAIARGKRPAS